MKLRCESGQSLMGMLAASAIGMIVMIGFLSMMSNQRSSQRSLHQKYEMLELKEQLLSTFINKSVCTCQLDKNNSANPNLASLSGLVFDSTVTDGSQKVVVNRIYSGCLPKNQVIAEAGRDLPGTQTGLKVLSVEMTDLVPTGVTNEWQGFWTIDFEGTESLRQPVRVRQKFIVDPANPTQARIRACLSSTEQFQPTPHVFDTPGTFNFTVPLDVTFVKVELWGGGGGSSGGYGGSGGGGGYCSFSRNVRAGETYSFTVGQGGTAVQTWISTTSILPGGDSSFSTFCTARGGQSGSGGGGQGGEVVSTLPAGTFVGIKGGNGSDLDNHVLIAPGGSAAAGGQGGSFLGNGVCNTSLYPDACGRGQVPGGGGGSKGTRPSAYYPTMLSTCTPNTDFTCENNAGVGANGRVIIWH